MFIRNLNRNVCLLATSVCLMFLSQLTAAQEEPPEVEVQDSIVEGQRCVSSRPIRKTEVLDDQNILFYMRGTDIYLNHLPKPCKRLSESGRFLYRTTVARLCSADIINVLSDTGLGVTQGRACKLGNFYAITKEDVEKIKAPQEIKPKPVPPAEPEEPGTDQMGEAESTEDAEAGEPPVIEEK